MFVKSSLAYSNHDCGGFGPRFGLRKFVSVRIRREKIFGIPVDDGAWWFGYTSKELYED
jgi:hypothetical protein